MAKCIRCGKTTYLNWDDDDDCKGLCGDCYEELEAENDE
jgi:NMD protein affecting ribosome stability and mRNA decay